MTPHPKTHRMPHLLRVLLASFAALMMPLAAGAAAVADGDKSARTWTVRVGSQYSDQAIQGLDFLPGHLYVNAGDKVTWKANAIEIYTVTFLADGQSLASTQPFEPTNPQHIRKQGGRVYDGHSYFNSGVLSKASDTGFKEAEKYTLKFPDAGEFSYYCLVHGRVMKGTVHVREAGSDYPYTQSQYDRQSKQREREILRNGQAQWEVARDQANKHVVITGTDNGTAMLMRYERPKIVVYVGESVAFVNTGVSAPRTVAFGKEPADPFEAIGDPAAFTNGDLNSGLIAPRSAYVVTFNKAGKFEYRCALRGYLGTVGKVEVRD